MTFNSGIERESPVAKKPKLAPAPNIIHPIVPAIKPVASIPSTASSFSNNEVSTLKQLIQGEREMVTIVTTH